MYELPCGDVPDWTVAMGAKTRSFDIMEFADKARVSNLFSIRFLFLRFYELIANENKGSQERQDGCWLREDSGRLRYWSGTYQQMSVLSMLLRFLHWRHSIQD